MKMAESSSLKHVQYFRATDDRRPVAIFISGQFDEFEKFPPFMETEEEIQHVRADERRHEQQQETVDRDAPRQLAVRFGWNWLGDFPGG